jgi:hypothetical protein
VIPILVTALGSFYLRLGGASSADDPEAEMPTQPLIVVPRGQIGLAVRQLG